VFGRLKQVWEASREAKRLRKELAEAKDRIARQKRRIKRLEEEHEQQRLRTRVLQRSGDEEHRGLRPENIVWIFGTGRSGNTWLTAMMESAGHPVWTEPAIGKLFGEFYYGARDSQRGNAKFVLGDPRKDVWLGSVRRFVLDGASGRFPGLSGPEDYLVVKEQVGSLGAPLLSEALPESRMIFLVRDPRDVVSSWLDGSRSGGWHQANVARKKPERVSKLEDSTALVERLATHYAKNVGKAAEAYDAHQGPKALVRYEELREDTLGMMKRIHSTLGMEVDEQKLIRSVEEHSWENIPEEEKGEGKFRRKAKPGGWREDLTEEQARIVEETTRPLLEQFYP
jgi:hypothetical protein